MDKPSKGSMINYRNQYIVKILDTLKINNISEQLKSLENSQVFNYILVNFHTSFFVANKISEEIK